MCPWSNLFHYLRMLSESMDFLNPGHSSLCTADYRIVTKLYVLVVLESNLSPLYTQHLTAQMLVMGNSLFLNFVRMGNPLLHFFHFQQITFFTEFLRPFLPPLLALKMPQDAARYDGTEWDGTWNILAEMSFMIFLFQPHGALAQKGHWTVMSWRISAPSSVKGKRKRKHIWRHPSNAFQESILSAPHPALHS